MRTAATRLVFVGHVALAAAVVACTQFSSVPSDGGALDDRPPMDASPVEVAPRDSSPGDVGTAAPDASARSCDEPDLVGRWRLDEGVGERIADCSSGALHGKLYGGTWIDGRKGRKALSFVGGDTGSRVDLGDPAALKLEGAVTIVAWIQVRSVASYGRIFAKSASDGDRGWDFFVDFDGSLDFRAATGPSDYVDTSLRAFPLRQWKHVAAVFDPAVAVRLFVDGKLVASNTVAIPAAQRNSTRPAYIGARADCCTIDGALQDVRLYRRALAATEVERLFASDGP